MLHKSKKITRIRLLIGILGSALFSFFCYLCYRFVVGALSIIAIVAVTTVIGKIDAAPHGLVRKRVEIGGYKVDSSYMGTEFSHM